MDPADRALVVEAASTKIVRDAYLKFDRGTVGCKL